LNKKLSDAENLITENKNKNQDLQSELDKLNALKKELEEEFKSKSEQNKENEASLQSQLDDSNKNIQDLKDENAKVNEEKEKKEAELQSDLEALRQ